MRSRAGLSVAGLMTVVALVALSLAAFQVDFSLGSFVGVLAILTVYRFQVIATTCRKIGRPLERREHPAIFARCFGVSLVILGEASFAAVYIFLIGNQLGNGGRSLGSLFDSPFSLLLALLAAWYIARRRRIRLWPSPRCANL